MIKVCFKNLLKDLSSSDIIVYQYLICWLCFKIVKIILND